MLTKIQSWTKNFYENSQLGLKPNYSAYASKQDKLVLTTLCYVLILIFAATSKQQIVILVLPFDP